ncbi:MAG: histidine phosphatase family protein [Chloroflexota bacterium]
MRELESTPPPPHPRREGGGITLILVRHGETDWNLEGRYQGSVDVPLNATGREQAEGVAVGLSGQRMDAVYSSPLCRALDTAIAIARRQGLEVRTDPRLKEIDLGEWEGMLTPRIAEGYPELHRQWTVDPRPVRPPGGETIREVHDRAIAAVEEMAVRHLGGTVCVVTHKTAMVVIRSHYLGLELPEEMGKMPPNGGWERLEVACRSWERPCCTAAVQRRIQQIPDTL